MTITELLEDLLTEFDEFDMQPMLPMPGDPIEKAKAWKHELEYALKHLKAEVAREIFAEIDNMFIDFISLFHDNISKATIEQNKDKQQVNSVALSVIDTARKCLDELKKKFIGEQTDEKPDKY